MRLDPFSVNCNLSSFHCNSWPCCSCIEQHINKMNFNTFLRQARYFVSQNFCTYCFFVKPVPERQFGLKQTADFNCLVPPFRCCPWSRCCGMGDFRPRTVWLGHPEKREQKYPRNVINNQKYNFFTFLPAVSMSQRSHVHLFPFLWLL